MSIPKNISREHVIQAIKKINEEGIPWRRQSTKYSLIYENEYYPPKYVLSIANLFANGEEYSSYDFSGGDETNNFLLKLGFTLVSTDSNPTDEESKKVLFKIFALEPVNRSREYQSYDDSVRDRVVYEYLFNSQTHRWIDEHVIGLNPEESRGYQAMGILHFIGLKDKHKGIFKDLSIDEAINLLEQQDLSYGLVNQCLSRLSNQIEKSLRFKEAVTYDANSEKAGEGSYVKDDSVKEEVPAIRLLPMSENDPEFTGKSIEEVQAWFINELPYREYNFKNGMNADSGTLVLFQYKAHVIASAILEEKIMYEEESKGIYRGAYYFVPSSIAVFTPITTDEMKNIWTQFKGFNQSLQNLDVNQYVLFYQLLLEKNIRNVLDDDIDEESFQKQVETVSINHNNVVVDKPRAKQSYNHSSSQKLIRNPAFSKRAIVTAKYSCEIDSNHEDFISKVTGKNYVEAHHLIPMEYQDDFEKSIDVEANIVSLCVICHKTLHHATFTVVKPLIEKLYNERIKRLKDCDIELTKEKLLSYYK